MSCKDLIDEILETEERVNERLYELGVDSDPELTSLLNLVFYRVVERLKKCEKST